MSTPVKPTISVVIIAKDEADRIGDCLASVEFADESIVADTGSSDITPQIAKNAGATVFDLEFQGFGKTKQAAIEHANCDWILSIDADERVPEALQEEIQRVVSQPGATDGYQLPRLTWFLGKPIRHGGWYPDYQLRLFKRGKGRFSEAPVHEKVIVNGRVERLRNPLHHKTVESFSSYLAKIDHYSTLAAAKIAERSKRPPSLFTCFNHAWSIFIRNYFIKAGWLDGTHGALLAYSSSYAKFLKYMKARIIMKGLVD